MAYQLSKTDVNQLQTLRGQIPLHYSDEDAVRLVDIIDRALLNVCLDNDDVYELLEVLPKIIPSSQEKTQSESEIQNTDWNEYIDERRARYKREMERLHQILSNWVFMQSAVYRKNMEPFDRPTERSKANNIGLGIKK
jgi:DNA-binding transcriptional MerR regulator